MGNSSTTDNRNYNLLKKSRVTLQYSKPEYKVVKVS